MIPYGRQSIDDADIQAVIDTLRSDWLTQGPAVGKLEAADDAVNRVSVRHRHAGDLGSGTTLDDWIRKISRLAAQRAVSEGEAPVPGGVS